MSRILESDILAEYDKCSLDASLPATLFYEHRGFQTVEHRKHELGARNGAAVDIGRFLQIHGKPFVTCLQQIRAEGSDNTRPYKTKGRIQHTHFGDHEVLRNNEDLRRDHHLYQNQGKEEFFSREFQTAEGISSHRCRKTCTNDPEKDHKQSVFIQNQKIIAFPDCCKILPVPSIMRKNVERID